MEAISSHLFERKLWVTFWDLWHLGDRGETLDTFSSLTVTTQQNSFPISSRTTITSQLSLHAQTGLHNSFGREWVLHPCISVYVPSMCVFVGLPNWAFIHSSLLLMLFCSTLILEESQPAFSEWTRTVMSERDTQNKQPDACRSHHTCRESLCRFTVW